MGYIVNISGIEGITGLGCTKRGRGYIGGIMSRRGKKVIGNIPDIRDTL